MGELPGTCTSTLFPAALPTSRNEPSRSSAIPGSACARAAPPASTGSALEAELARAAEHLGDADGFAGHAELVMELDRFRGHALQTQQRNEGCVPCVVCRHIERALRLECETASEPAALVVARLIDPDVLCLENLPRIELRHGDGRAAAAAVGVDDTRPVVWL